jgi:FKBP-type peptidyl-prolyl cis-trans isomerase FklB
MNTRLFALTLITAASLTAPRAEEAPTFKDDKEKANYAYGLNIGSSFKQNNLEYDSAAFDRGIKDALAGKLTLNPQEQRDAFMKYQGERRALIGVKNKADGEAFLAANKSKPGVQTLASGLQYKVLAGGSGESPKPEDICVVKYRGTLIDGTEFDSSEKAPGGTASFPANRVIPGWTEALTHMKPGAKWQLAIPSNLAYGEPGFRNIAPNSALLFDVELVSFSTPPPPAPTPAPAPLTSDIIKVPSLEEMKKGAKIETIKAEEVEKLQKDQPKEKK